MPASTPVRTTARMAAFIPGASPPLVKTAMRFINRYCSLMLRVRTVAALSFVFTGAFFAEYLPTFKRLRIPYDLAGYHYPLADYAFQALKEGRFPQWDAAIYSGTSFVGNIQAALFYPPMWLAFAANAGRRALSYQALEDLIFAHVWVAFLLCFLWLRRKGLADLACVLGAGVYAYSGYLCQQLQHLGLVAAYAWMPLGLWGIDDAVGQRRWQPLWKVTAASALCFLGGYVPMWVVFCVCMLSYAAWRWKALLGTGLALAASIPIVMVQLLPAWEAASLKVHELKYGWGVRDAEYVIASLLPNYFDYSLGADPNSVHQYLYLGAPAIAGLLWLVHSRRRQDLIGIGIMLGVALIFATNPGNLVWNVVKHSHLGAEVLRDWYFLAGVMLAMAGLAAFGLDAALRAKRTALPPWAAWSVTALLAAWVLRDLVLWSRGQQLTGWKSAIDAGVALTLCALALYILPGQGRAPRTVLAAALLVFAGTQYKVYGIGKHFNAGYSMARWDYSSGKFHVMDQQPYDEIRKHPEYRIAVDSPRPSLLDLRHYRLTSPP